MSIPPYSCNGMQCQDGMPSSTTEVERGGGAAVAIARQAQRLWAAQPLTQRLQLIRRLRHEMALHAVTLAQCVTEIPGRTPTETLVAEVLPLADACRFLESQAPRLLAPKRLSRGARPLWLWGGSLEIHRDPLGVVLIIAASNYPLFLPGVQVLQALVAGNAVLLKPGRGGSAAARALAHHLAVVGLDRRLLHVLPEVPAVAQAAIHAGVDKVLMTGATSSGAAVLAALAPRLTPAVMELSGCDAAFVRADADLQLVGRALAFSLRLNSGATCIAPRRVFVARTVAAPLEAYLTYAAKAMAPCAVAPDTAARVQELVAEACAQGARCLAGDFFPEHRLTPVVIADAVPTMRLLQTDVFAPILALVPVSNDDDALAAAAQCSYALGATVFGQEAGARALALRAHAGVVVVNDVIVPTADPRLPFAGRGHSGFGATRGAEGLLELTHIKAIAVRRGRWRPHYEPPLPQDEALFRNYLAAAHGASLRGRVAAALACLRTLGTRLWP
jgi:acyl-CoA reductase-like NAD-dependent aldehyde dehydrogenase